MPTPKAAVVGIGFIGPVHVEALRRLGIPVLGVCGVTPEEARGAAERLGLPKGYASLEEVLADPEVDAVHLAVPNVLHYEMAKKAIAAGKHVLCEKPLAMTAKESAELVELAEASGLVCAVSYNIRFYPLNLEARTRIARGDLGSIHAVNGSYVQDWLLYDTDYNWRVLAEQGGALRAVADIGTHWLDLVCSITGLEVESVFADLHTVHKTRKRPLGEVETFSGKTGGAPPATEEIPITTEDWAAILLRFANGARGSFHVSQVTAGRKNRLCYEISGANGAFAWDSQSPNELWIGSRNEANQSLLRDPGLLSDAVRPFANYPGGHNEGFPDAFKQLFRAFYAAVAEGKPPAKPNYPTFADGHREVAFCDAVIESAAQERWIKL